MSNYFFLIICSFPLVIKLDYIYVFFKKCGLNMWNRKKMNLNIQNLNIQKYVLSKFIFAWRKIVILGWASFVFILSCLGNGDINHQLNTDFKTLQWKKYLL